MTIQELQRERARLWDVFMEQGGRGVDLADRIDALDAKMLDADELGEDGSAQSTSLRGVKL